MEYFLFLPGSNSFKGHYGRVKNKIYPSKTADEASKIVNYCLPKISLSKIAIGMPIADAKDRKVIICLYLLT